MRRTTARLGSYGYSCLRLRSAHRNSRDQKNLEGHSRLLESAQSGWHGPPTSSTTHEVCICIQYQACRPLLAGLQPTRPVPQPRARPPPLYPKPFSSNKRCIGKSAHRRPRDTRWESSRCPTTPQGNVRSCGTSAAAHRAHTGSVVPVPAVSDARGDMDAVVANSPGS